jgi:hypothetical protein
MVGVHVKSFDLAIVESFARFVRETLKKTLMVPFIVRPIVANKLKS